MNRKLFGCRSSTLVPCTAFLLEVQSWTFWFWAKPARVGGLVDWSWGLGWWVVAPGAPRQIDVRLRKLIWNCVSHPKWAWYLETKRLIAIQCGFSWGDMNLRYWSRIARSSALLGNTWYQQKPTEKNMNGGVIVELVEHDGILHGVLRSTKASKS